MDSVLYTEEFVRHLLLQAYRAGHAGPLELDEQTADDLLASDPVAVHEKMVAPLPGEEDDHDPQFRPAPAPVDPLPPPRAMGNQRFQAYEHLRVQAPAVDEDLFPAPEYDLPPPGDLPHVPVAAVQINHLDDNIDQIARNNPVRNVAVPPPEAYRYDA